MNVTEYPTTSFEIDNVRPRTGRPVPSAAAQRPTLDAARLWTGGLATALVAALVGLVGTLVIRVADQFLPHGHALLAGLANPVVICAGAAVAALAATAVAHLLLVSTPRPLAYIGWIVGLSTAAAAVLPFTTTAALGTALATGLLHLVIGMAIGSLVLNAASAAVRIPGTDW